MKIIFDARQIKEIYSGLARYTHSILYTLIKTDSFDKLEILLDQNENYSTNPLFKNIELNSKSEKIQLTYIDAPLFKFKHHISVSKYVNESDCDLYFYSHFDIPIFIKKRSIFVIHDLLPLIVNNYILKYKFLKKQFFKNIIALNLSKKNTQCIVVSESTKSDVLRIINKKYKYKLKVVYEDSFEDVIKQNIKNEKVNEILNLDYLLYIGDRRPHKNLKEMIDIFKILKNKYNYNGYFIIAGSEKNYDIDLENYILNESNIKVVGRVSDKELVNLYNNMNALFFLSTYEGFGLPIVEAAKYNKKIIVSNSSSCGEISPVSALKINLKDEIQDKAYKINNYIQNTEKIDNKEYLENFSWLNSVKEIFGGVQ